MRNVLYLTMALLLINTTSFAAGSECPANSGKYCSNELPYCCGSTDHYCAKDVNGCTKE